MRALNLSEVEEAGEYEKLAPGGYVCVIKQVKDQPAKEYLEIEFDIAEGKYKGYFQRLSDAKGFWGGRMIRSYKSSALPFFKSFTSALAKSNAGFVWGDETANDERKMIGKYVGIVLGEEEYLSNENAKKVRLCAVSTRSVDSIRKNEYTVPSLKPLSNTASVTESPKTSRDPSDCPPPSDYDLPF